LDVSPNAPHITNVNKCSEIKVFFGNSRARFED